jgi:hypothetical protein
MPKKQRQNELVPNGPQSGDDLFSNLSCADSRGHPLIPCFSLAFISRPSWTPGSLFLEETPRGRHDDDVVGRSTMIRQHVALRRRPDLSLSLSCREAAWTGFCVSHLMHWASLLTRPSQSEELSFNEDMNLWKIKVARTMRSQTLYLVLLSREESHAFRHFSYRLLFF